PLIGRRRGQSRILLLSRQPKALDKHFIKIAQMANHFGNCPAVAAIPIGMQIISRDSLNDETHNSDGASEFLKLPFANGCCWLHKRLLAVLNMKYLFNPRGPL